MTSEDGVWASPLYFPAATTPAAVTNMYIVVSHAFPPPGRLCCVRAAESLGDGAGRGDQFHFPGVYFVLSESPNLHPRVRLLQLYALRCSVVCTQQESQLLIPLALRSV